MNLNKNLKIARSVLLLSLTLIPLSSNSEAQVGPGSPGWVCKNIVPINAIPGGGVLYKPENLHGGRGPSFLVQNVAERTNKQEHLCLQQTSREISPGSVKLPPLMKKLLRD